MPLTIGTRDKILHADGIAEELTRLVTCSLERMRPEEKEELRRALRTQLLSNPKGPFRQ
jgi:hypothetical protein